MFTAFSQSHFLGIPCQTGGVRKKAPFLSRAHQRCYFSLLREPRRFIALRFILLSNDGALKFLLLYMNLKVWMFNEHAVMTHVTGRPMFLFPFLNLCCFALFHDGTQIDPVHDLDVG